MSSQHERNDGGGGRPFPAPAKEPLEGEDWGPASDWELVLYVVAESPLAESAERNLRRICTERLGTSFDISVIDIRKDPETAERDDILAVPLVVRKKPLPEQKVVGDLSDGEVVAGALDLPRPHKKPMREPE
jgi:circadian clock protein KaiB